MKKKVIDIYNKYSEIVNYLIVGVMTTIVSVIFYYVFTRTILNPMIPLELQIANIIKWVSGVLFAYFTNRKFVFHSTRTDYVNEFCQFTSSRLLTLFLDMFIMWILVIKFLWYDLIATIISQFIVIVGNYIISKFFVFSNRKKQ